MTAEHQGSQSRRHRFQRHRYGKPSFVLQDRDSDIIRLVADHRIISSEEVQWLIPGSRQSILRRLQKLYHGGFLDRPRYQKLEPNRKMVYALGQRGAALLAQASGAGASATRDLGEQNRQLKIGFLEHSLMVSRFRTALEVACRNRGDVVIESWRQDDELRDRVAVEHADRVERIPVCPDAMFILRLVNEPEGRNRIHVFLEADRSTMPLKRFLTKMRGYWHYRQTGRQSERFGINNFLVLTVAPSVERAENLCQVTYDIEGSKLDRLRMFLFGTEGNYRSDEPSQVLEPIWQTPGDPDQHSLLE
jgi:hypothetical protein